MTKDAVIKLIAQEMNCSPHDITLQTKLTDLGVDSLKAIVILSVLEDQFKIEIPNEAMESISTVGDIVAKVDALRPKNPS